MSTERARSIASEILSRHRQTQGVEVAFLEDSGTIFYAIHSPIQAKEPVSSVTRLIQGIYGHQPRMARKIARNRIFTTGSLTEMCRGMVRVAAKRITAEITPLVTPNLWPTWPTQWSDVSETPCGLNRDFSPLAPLPTSANSDSHWLQLAKTACLEIPRPSDKNLFELDRPVAAVLISSDGKLLAFALNAGSLNRTLHAEINLLQSYYRHHSAPIPRGARIITTLKPCRMCAGMIWTSAEDFREIHVVYGEFDPGPNARITVLDAHSPERRRAVSTAQDLALPLERQLVALMSSELSKD